MIICLSRNSGDFIAELKHVIAYSATILNEGDILHMHCCGVAVRTMMDVNSLQEYDQVDVTLRLAHHQSTAAAAKPRAPLATDASPASRSAARNGKRSRSVEEHLRVESVSTVGTDESDSTL